MSHFTSGQLNQLGDKLEAAGWHAKDITNLGQASVERLTEIRLAQPLSQAQRRDAAADRAVGLGGRFRLRGGGHRMETFGTSERVRLTHTHREKHNRKLLSAPISC